MSKVMSAVAPNGKSAKRLRVGPIAFQNIVILSVLILVSTGMALTSSKFLSLSNFSNIMVQASLVIMTGSAVTLVIISGNLDLSVGGIMAMGGVLYAMLSQAGLAPYPWSALLSVLVAGSVMGALNGVLVSRMRIPSFIATLGVMYITRGIAYIGAKGTTIAFGLPIDFAYLGTRTLGPVPLPIVYTVVIFAAFVLLQAKTKLGKETFAIGSNPKAATLSGIHSGRILVILYVLSGTLAAFSGVVFTARVGTGDCTIGSGFEFDVFTAVVLGGTSMSGGKGSVIGMVLGALLLRALTNGLNLAGLASYYQSIISGVVLVLAILLNRYIISRSSSVIDE